MKAEEVLCFCRKHWIVILHYLLGIPILWAVLIINAIYARAIGGIPQILAVPGLILAIYLHHFFFIKIFNFYLQTVIVTNYRVINMDRTLFFRDSRNTLDIKEIQDVVMQRDGFMRTILNYGDLKILLSSVSEPIRLRYIPNPEYHFRKIHKTKREYILNRQIEKESQLQFQGDRYPEIIRQQSQVKESPTEIDRKEVK